MTHHTTGRRWLRRFTTGTTTAGLLMLAVPAAVEQLPERRTPQHPAQHSGQHSARAVTTAPVQLVGHRKPHPHRVIKRYRVRPGDTPSSIAVRYHAWTAQLIRMNHSSVLYAGQVIRVPIVAKASRACTKHRHHRTGLPHYTQPGGTKATPQHKPHKPRPKPRPEPEPAPKPDRRPASKHQWTNADASRAEVRRAIIRRANRFDVNPDLALAISWQESGWQQHRVSSAGALGAMQVMPATGRWMSLLVGRKLHLRDLGDNVTAGVALISTLRDQAELKHAVAGYYQGLAGVRRHGMYPSTKQYVANVLHLKERIAHGWNPA